MKQLIIVLLALLSGQAIIAQSALDFQYGSSKADYNFWTFRATAPILDRWRVGVEMQASDYRYRFIDARPVSGGFAAHVRLVAIAKLADNGKIRLDAFIKPGLRMIQAPDEAQDFENYTFQDSRAITIDPGLLVTWKPFERLAFHTGFNSRMVFQTIPEFIPEQLPSGLVLFGSSYALADRWTLFATGNTGSMYGAGGDTEKYNWEFSMGFRFALGKNSNRSENLILGF